MDKQTFYIERWMRFSEQEQAALAQAVTPEGFTFEGIERCALSDQVNNIAFYRWRDGARFALVPGNSSAELGYNPSTMESAARAIYDRWSEQESGSQPDYIFLPEDWYFPYLQRLTPLRSAEIAPFLCEVEVVDHRQNIGVVHADILAEVEAAGFHLPTPDEWEYACAAGTRSLFRWGGEMPMVIYPGGVDELLDVLEMEYDDDEIPAEEMRPLINWNLYKLPNAFGLQMPDDTYNWELTSIPGIMRGADGGMSVCGPVGLFAQWIPLASAYEHDWRAKYENYGKVYGAGLRRVVHLTD